MSAGRFDWTARSFDHVDEATGIACAVVATLGVWTWTVHVPGQPSRKGVAASVSAAKGQARKALEAAAKVSGETEKKR